MTDLVGKGGLLTYFILSYSLGFLSADFVTESWGAWFAVEGRFSSYDVERIPSSS